MRSIIKNEEILTLHVQDPRADTPDHIVALIQDRTFWVKLKALEVVLEPIHTAQKMAESTHSFLQHIWPRWIDIKAHLNAIALPAVNSWSYEIKAYLDRGKCGFKERIAKQLLPIHKVAYIVHPSNHSQWSHFNGINKSQVTEFLDTYTGTTVLEQFYDYLDEKEAFHTSKKIWTKTDNPKLFWRLAVRLYQLLISRRR